MAWAGAQAEGGEVGNHLGKATSVTQFNEISAMAVLPLAHRAWMAHRLVSLEQPHQVLLIPKLRLQDELCELEST